MPRFLLQAKRPGHSEFSTRQTFSFVADDDGKKEAAALDSARRAEADWRNCGIEHSTDFRIVREGRS